MKILFLSHYFSPHVGGVEKHIYLLSRELIVRGNEVTVLTEKFDPSLKDIAIIDGIRVIRFEYPKTRFVGILFIWLALLENYTLLRESDVIHIHDVFIWYLPFRFVLPNKVFTTIHGLEWGNPFSFSGTVQKKIAFKLSRGTIGIGKFLEKYLKVKFDLVSYGATNIPKKHVKKDRNRIVFVGRLSKDTGVLKFIEWLKENKKLKVDFVGDGELKKKCKKYGTVHGFTDPERFLKKASYCVPGGYLACLEAFAYKCKVKVFWQDQLKEDYWRLSPMYRFIEKEDITGAFRWVSGQSWKKLTDKHIKLWNI